MRRLGDIYGLVTGDVQRAKSELARHCAEITLTPEGQTYRISGDWNLLGGRSGGAGGPACTALPQASLGCALRACGCRKPANNLGYLTAKGRTAAHRAPPPREAVAPRRVPKTCATQSAMRLTAEAQLGWQGCRALE